MNLPRNENIRRYGEDIEVFYGLNQRERISNGELAETHNCSARKYPTLSPRYRRGFNDSYQSIQGMIQKDALCFVYGGNFYINGYPIQGFYLDPTTRKTLVGIGAYVCIFPDKMYINTVNTSDRGYMENSFTSAGIALSLCDMNGEAINASTTKPTDPDVGDYYIDTTGESAVLMKWNGEKWIEIPTTYTKLSKTGIGVGFNKYDGVLISGFSVPGLNGNLVIHYVDNNNIVVPYLLEEVATETNSVTIKRTVPDMDFVVESNNRLWGCKYGFVGNSTINEIYACALGDFKNWNRYMGISTDSYTASRGCDGQWTGAVTYLGNPLFFKANTIESVYPSASGGHRIESVNINGTGIKLHCGASAAVVDGAVYYLSDGGFYRYTGSLPEYISDALGDHYYHDARGGDLSGFYYVNCLDENDKVHNFVYDTHRGLWYEEDDISVDQYCRVDNELYFSNDDGLYTVRGTAGEIEKDLKWSAVTHNIAYQYNDVHCAEIIVRADIPVDTRLSVYIAYDGSNRFEMLGYRNGDGTSIHYNINLVPRKCDSFRLKIKGNGDSSVWGIYNVYNKG